MKKANMSNVARNTLDPPNFTSKSSKNLLLNNKTRTINMHKNKIHPNHYYY